MSATAVARADERPLREVIDAEIRAAWERQKLTPAQPAGDAEFLRRVYLDLVGNIPTHDEARAFLNDARPAKRAELIDRLLADPRFAKAQADVWDQVFFGRNPPDAELTKRRGLFRQWLTERFAKNEPYDKWAAELLTADGSTAECGPVMFYAQFRNQPEEAATAVSRIFLGLQLQCARCHDHPFDKWLQTDFYGFAGFFARLAFVEGSAGGKRNYVVCEKSTGEVMFTGPAAQQKAGQKGKPVPAKFLAGAVVDEPALPKDFKEPDLKGVKSPPKPVFSRKRKLADWMTTADNPYFARAAANRVWAQFLGRGLVHPIDDLGDNSQGNHAALLKMIGEQLSARKFDLKWLIRELVNTRTYQLAATGATGDALPEWFQRARIRPLSAEEMDAALRTAADGGAAPKKSDKPAGEPSEYFLRYLGEPLNGQGDFQASLGEHLFMGNSGQVRQMLRRRKGNLADTLCTSSAPWAERVERLFLTVLSRPPRPEEAKRFAEFLSADPKADARVEDAIWALVNGAEFRFNH